MRYFCTYFDENYLPRGLALYASLARVAGPFRLWVLCLSTECFDALTKLALPNMVPVPMDALQRGDDALLAAKASRSRIEYYFTCTPSLLRYVLRNEPAADLVTYLDADLYFFSDPAPVFDEVADHSAGIIGHRFPPHLRHKEVYGTYNVGWVSIRRDAEGERCLEWWRQRCNEWCYDRCEPGRFADQKYLDAWPERFANVRVIQHVGANLAPWNVGNYRVRRGPSGVTVDGQPLVFFHFHRFRQLNAWIFDPNLDEYAARSSPALERGIFAPYHAALLEANQRAAAVVARAGTAPHDIRYQRASRHGAAPSLASRVRERARSARTISRALLTRRWILSAPQVFGGGVKAL